MSTLNVSNISDGTDTVETGYVVNGSAKAWVNFNGTGTVAVRSSLNTSSITDVGTGNYFQNFTSGISDYVITSTQYLASRGNGMAWNNTTSNAIVRIYDDAGAITDSDIVANQVIGDLL
jgi:hypothetical protein